MHDNHTYYLRAEWLIKGVHGYAHVQVIELESEREKEKKDR